MVCGPAHDSAHHRHPADYGHGQRDERRLREDLPPSEPGEPGAVRDYLYLRLQTGPCEFPIFLCHSGGPVQLGMQPDSDRPGEHVRQEGQ